MVPFLVSLSRAWSPEEKRDWIEDLRARVVLEIVANDFYIETKALVGDLRSRKSSVGLKTYLLSSILLKG